MSKIPEFDLINGVKKLCAAVEERFFATSKAVIVLIAGGSASGKTSSVARSLKEHLDKEIISSAILSMDDYYRGKKFMDAAAAKGNILNWDQPEAVDIDLLLSHLQALKMGRSIEKPKYSFKTGEVEGFEKLDSPWVVIVEGLFTLNSSLLSIGDVKVFVDVGFHGRILRRLLRDIERTKDAPADILDYFSKIVEPMHEMHVQSTKVNADFVINNEYCPKVEAERSGLHEVQIKFRTDFRAEDLRKLGAERLAFVAQRDYYYNPKDRDLKYTGEILRIRKEGDSIILTYKGPKINSEFRERPKFEFEIAPEVQRRFVCLYGNEIKNIIKTRYLFQLSGVVFSLDSVSKAEKSEPLSAIGRFLEIRSTDKSAGEDKIKEVLQRLGLDISQGIKESYFEM